MRILGLNAFYHDSAAAIIDDGRVLVAVEEERFTRIKHDNQFPLQSVEFCLGSQKLTISDIDYVVYYEKSLLRFERVLDNFVKTYPYALRPFIKGIPEWFNHKLQIERKIRKDLGFKGKILYIPHHASHAAAAFYPSGFSRSAVLTVDGIGEYQTTGLWFGRENQLTPLKSLDFPHSVGLFYSTFTAFLGFRVNEDEYKVMGLGAYGKPYYIKKILKTLDLKNDGSIHLDLSYYSFPQSERMWSKKFEILFGKPRLSHEKVKEKHKDIARSCQAVLEMIYFKMLNHLYKLTRVDNVCIGGGVALNALANGKIYHETPFKHVYIFGAAGDNGSAVGAALFAYHHVLTQEKGYPLTSLSLGSKYLDGEIKQVLDGYKLHYQKYTHKELVAKTASLLAEGKIVGWFEGRMEFGPRALGNRSILASPYPRNMKQKVNTIKIREQFRPFAGSILEEKVDEYFDVPEKQHKSPFMLFCFNVRKGKRSNLAAIVHKDYTCRIQTVAKKDNNLYYSLIKEFDRLTGVPCLLNTSFNLKGEPLVETPRQAVNDFLKTKIDYLVIGSFIVYKKGASSLPETFLKRLRSKHDLLY